MIHPTATIESGASIADDVRVGAFCHISSGVTLASGVVVDAHVTIHNRVEVGADTHIYPHTHIGNGVIPITIGSECHIREFCHIGTDSDESLSIAIGSRCYIMAYVQIHQGSTVEDGCTITIKATLKEGSRCEARVIVGARATVGAGCIVGTGSMIGAFSAVQHHIPPFCLVEGYPKARIRGLNLVGMRRAFEHKESINATKRVFATLKKVSFDPKEASEMLPSIEDEQARVFVSFVSRHYLNIADPTLIRVEPHLMASS